MHTDHLNTPRLVTDSVGAAVWRWDQIEPFGVNVPDENPSGLGAFEFPLRFPGQYADKETGLHYNYFRDYDPAVGRYVESDPIGLLGGLSTYAYASGMPLTGSDQFGLQPLFSTSLGQRLGNPQLNASIECESNCLVNFLVGSAITDTVIHVGAHGASHLLPAFSSVISRAGGAATVASLAAGNTTMAKCIQECRGAASRTP